MKNNSDTDAHTETRLCELTSSVWWKYSARFQNSRNLLRSKFFPRPETGLFWTVIAARRSDPRFSRLLYSRRWIYSTAPRISTDTENMA